MRTSAGEMKQGPWTGNAFMQRTRWFTIAFVSLPRLPSAAMQATITLWVGLLLLLACLQCQIEWVSARAVSAPGLRRTPRFQGRPGADERYDSFPAEEFSASSSRRYRGAKKAQEPELVRAYTNSLSKRTTIAVSSGLSAVLLSHLFLKVLISRAFALLSMALGALCAMAVFLRGDVSDFARSLGVFSMLLLLRAQPLKVAHRIVRQLKGVVAERRPFPPGSNPWRYRPREGEDDDPEFSMMSALGVVAVASGLLGWTVAKPIPLLPSWLLGLIGALVGGYTATLQDTPGDLLRFFAHLVLATWTELSLTADEVDLRARTTAMFSQTFGFLRGVDDRLHVVDTVQAAVADAAGILTSLLLRSRVSTPPATDQRRRPAHRDEYAPRR